MAISTIGTDGLDQTNNLELGATGNVGIGTATPSTKLHVYNSGDVTTTIQSNTGASIINLTSNSNPSGAYNAILSNTASGQNWYIGGLGNNNTMVFATGASTTERMRIDASGNVLVGTTSNASNSPKIYVVQTTTNAAGIQTLTPNSYTGQAYNSGSYATAGTGWYHFVGQSGNGTSITTNNILIYGNGNVQNANNSYGAISDETLKENIVDASPKLDDLCKVKIRNFNLIDDESKTKQIGVIAQELEQIFPSMIETDKDGLKGVKYSIFVPMLVKAIQEQQALITDLTTRLAALENK